MSENGDNGGFFALHASTFELLTAAFSFEIVLAFLSKRAAAQMSDVGLGGGESLLALAGRRLQRD